MDIKLDDVSGWYTYKLMEMFKENIFVSWKEIYDYIRGWTIFNDPKANPKAFMNDLEEKDIVTKETRGTKKNPKTVFGLTKKGRFLYKKYAKIYGDNRGEIKI